MTYPMFDIHSAGMPLSEWELREALGRVKDVMRQPRGSREKQMKAIAADYGVSVRTLQRWCGYTFHEVRVGGFRALYQVGTGQPVRVTAWERAA